MSDKPKTAVQWYIDRHYEILSMSFKGVPDFKKELHRLLDEAEAKALAMEREDKCKFADEYADAVMGGCLKRAEQYYTETYGE
jgi:hypothetical protein